MNTTSEGSRTDDPSPSSIRRFGWLPAVVLLLLGMLSLLFVVLEQQARISSKDRSTTVPRDALTVIDQRSLDTIEEVRSEHPPGLLLRDLNAAAQKRGIAEPDDQPTDPATPRRQETEGVNAASRSLDDVGDKLLDALDPCVEFMPLKATGQVSINVKLGGSRETGAEIRSVEVTKDTLGDSDLVECMKESMYTFDFDDPHLAVFDDFTFVADANDRAFWTSTAIDLADIWDVLEVHPEMSYAMHEAAEHDDDVREALHEGS